jgi:hypothetical protein
LVLTKKVRKLIVKNNNKFLNRCQQPNQIQKYQPRQTQLTQWKERERKQQLKRYHSASRRWPKTLKCSSSNYTNDGVAMDGEWQYRKYSGSQLQWVAIKYMLILEPRFLHRKHKKSRMAVFRKHKESIVRRLVDQAQKLTL